jgi:hypothetical protein
MKKCIQRLPRLRSYVKFMAGFMFWIPKSEEDAMKRIQKLEKDVQSD